MGFGTIDRESSNSRETATPATTDEHGEHTAHQGWPPMHDLDGATRPPNTSAFRWMFADVYQEHYHARCAALDPSLPGNRPVDPTLILDTSQLVFPGTPVGSETILRTTIRNPDRGPHTLDPVQSTSPNLFRDFTVKQMASEVIAADGNYEIEVTFRPSRAGNLAQTFELSTDGGFGPGARLFVVGMGTDETTTQARINDENLERELESDVRKDYHLQPQRNAANAAIEAWAKTAALYNHEMGSWTLRNWNVYLGKTGGDFHIADPSRAVTFLKRQVPKAVGKLLKFEGGGFVTAQAVELIVSKLSNFIFDQVAGVTPAPSPDDVALTASQRTAERSNSKLGEIDNYTQLADLAIDDTKAGALLRIERGNDAMELKQWAQWAETEREALPRAPGQSDTSLADELLVQWLVEHAATPTSAGRDTNHKAWDAARTDLEKRGKAGALQSSDMFIHQCRHEWETLGLPMEEIDANIAIFEAKRLQAEAEARIGGLSDSSQLAGYVADQLRLTPVFHRSANPSQTAAAFAAKDVTLAAETRDGRQFGREFTLDCNVVLATKGSSVYVVKFVYAMSGAARHSDIERAP